MKKTSKTKVQYLSIVLIAISLFTFNTIVSAEDHPKEAVDACFDKQEGDICDYNNQNGNSVNGQCRGIGASGEGKLFCDATR